MQSKLERLYEVADRAVEIARNCKHLQCNCIRAVCECWAKTCPCLTVARDAQKAVEVEKSTLNIFN